MFDDPDYMRGDPWGWNNSSFGLWLFLAGLAVTWASCWF